MSLRVWLPLTKDLRNQGLDNVTVTNNGAAFNSAGKLGGCYSFNGSSKIVNTLPSTVSSPIGSLSCWVKMNSLPGSSSFYNLMQVGNLGGYANCRLGLYMEYTNNINISINGSSTGVNIYRHSLVANQWYHICATFDGTIVKLYIDGNEVLSKTASGGSYTTAASYLYIGGTSSYYLNGYLNDARYYDHCLSPMEVKEISKGLVLHYPLNRRGWGQENLLTDTNFTADFVSSMVVNNGINLGQWRNESANVSLTMDGDYVKLHYETNTARYGIHYEIALEPGTYTYSITAGGRMTCSFGLATGWPSTNVITTNVAGRFSQTFTVSEAANYRMYIYTTSTNPDIWFNWPKLEAGDKATSWCPNSSDALATTMDLNGITEYDCSGYCNNGTRTGTFSWTSDTPKYSVSTYFEDGSTSYITTPVFMPTDKITTSVWFKGDGSTSGANSYHIPFCIGSGYAEFSVESSKLYRQGYYINGTRYCDTISGAIVNDGNWHMMTATYDGTILCRYLDGQLINSKNISGTLNGGNLTLLIGKYYSGGYNNKKVKQSDVRIYATALSADDVKSLYQNSAYIDSSGNVYGAVHSEV